MISGISQLNACTTKIDFSATKSRQEEIFSQMDTNGDGSVDKAEFTAFGLKMAQKIGKTDKSDEIFSRMDSDGDGQISKTEFQAFDQKMASKMGPPPGDPEKMFSQIDTNGDGQISQDELTAFDQLMAEETGRSGKGDNIFPRMDTDGDGQVSKSEFEAFGEKMKSQETSAAAAQSATIGGLSGDTIQTLLDALDQNNSDYSSLYKAAIAQYTGSFQTNTNSVLDLVG